MVSAGPRKSAKEYGADPGSAELCEDSAGTCWVGNRLVFWLSDGASDGRVILPLPPVENEETPPPVFGFSARILAQDLGQAFVKQVSQMLKEEGDIRTEIDAAAIAFNQVAADWEDRLATHVAIEEKRGGLDVFLDTLPEDGVDKSRSVIWAATFIGGVFDQKSQTLRVWNYGDCGGYIMAAPTHIPPNRNMVLLSARIRPDENFHTKVKIVVRDKAVCQIYSGVEGFAVMSDGIDRGNIDKYLSFLQMQKFASLADLRAELLRNKAHTWDDRSIIFGRFVEDQR
jgi:hypothetical protein